VEHRKKLIEVALPLEAINFHSAREKSIRHGHPSTLHLWWARRPLAAARAVIFTSLIDDPDQEGVPQDLLDQIDELPILEKYAPDANATIGEVRRQKLFGFIEQLVKWENSNNPEVLKTAHSLIHAATEGNPPPLLDPFAGGGAIPLEAQRLGLEAHASDLNPVAVMINKAMIEIPPKFAGQKPINPEAKTRNDYDAKWPGATGLAEDVRYYGEWMKKKAFEKIGHLYPKVKDEQGKEHTVIAWIWARTVKSPDPVANGAYVPLVSSLMLSTKKGKKAWVEIIRDAEAQDGWRFEVKTGELDSTTEAAKKIGTKAGKAKDFICSLTKSAIQRSYIQEEGKSDRLSTRLMAIVAEGSNGRIYMSPNQSHENIANASTASPNVQLAKETFLSGSTPTRAMITGGVCSAYGLQTWGHLFTDRQLDTLTTLIALVLDVQTQIEYDGGTKDYAQAVGVYLSFVVNKLADINSSICTWINTLGAIRNTFARQAIPMTWDYAEANFFSNSSGCYSNMLDWVKKVVKLLPTINRGGVIQGDAQTDIGYRRIMVSTDPPYYDNIGYATLSDFFYVWMRQSLKDSHPDLFRTMLVPKTEELVATPYRFDGSMVKARNFFENGMLQAFEHINTYARDEYPVTVYYAFKQSETDASENVASTGWETMLSAIIKAGLSIARTWPMRTEREARTVASGTNALASSIVLVCRKRPIDAPISSRRDFINALKRELKSDLDTLQSSNIAPVDLAQSAIGPGMKVYSQFSQVLEADGTPMSVRTALEIINQELDLYFNEQDGDLDRDSRFCVDLYTQNTVPFGKIDFGDADILARAKNTSVGRLAVRGILHSQKSIVRLHNRNEIPEKVEHDGTSLWLLTQQLTRALETGKGVQEAAQIIDKLFGSDGEKAKSLAYRLFIIAEHKSWTQEAFAYNALVVAWPEIQAAVSEIKSQTNNAAQLTLDEEN